MKVLTRAHRSVSLGSLLGIAATAIVPTVSKAADDGFYKDKTIRIVVSAEAGGAYDMYARLMVEHWPRHIAGNPSMIVQDMPGASGLKAANYLYSVAPRDGTVIGAVHSTIPISAIVAPGGAKYDPNKFSWIGSITKDPYVGYVTNTSPVQSFEDAKIKSSNMGAQSASSVGAQFALLSNAFAGTKVKLIVGYDSASGTRMAMERGEVDGTFANTWSAVKSQEIDRLQRGLIKVIVQHGLTKAPDLPDVPLLMDQVKRPEDKQALRTALSIQEFAKPYVAPPEIPAERLAMIRKSFDDTLKDPRFLADLHKMKLESNGPLTGSELAALVAELNMTPPSTGKRIADIYSGFSGNTTK